MKRIKYLILTLMFLGSCRNTSESPSQKGAVDYPNKTPEQLMVLTENGNTEAQFWLGLMHSNGIGVTKNLKKGIFWYQMAAEKGDAYSQYNLGQIYRQGQSSVRDPKKAIKWYQRAASQGDPEAQVNLGLIYYYGEGVQRDYVKAHKWYNLSGSIGQFGVDDRKDLERKMSPLEIEKAQKMAKDWKLKKRREK